MATLKMADLALILLCTVSGKTTPTG